MQQKSPKNIVHLVTGILLVLCFFSTGNSNTGFRFFLGILGYIAPGELNFWFSLTVLLIPGLLLICFYFQEILSQLATRMEEYLRNLSARDQTICLYFLAVILFIFARTGHLFLLFDRPITDDEYGAIHGGQIMASGKLMLPTGELFDAFKHPFFVLHNGLYSSMELPLTLAVWAVGIISGTGTLLWALLAAAPILPIALLVRNRLSIFWAILASAIFIVSPAALSLSMTSHAHLITRACLAFALLFIERAERKETAWNYFFITFFTGLACLSRTYEITCLLFPFYVFYFLRLFQTKRPSTISLMALVLGALGPLSLFCLYCKNITGSAFLDPRYLPAFREINFIGYPQHPMEIHFGLRTLWERLGTNLSYNLLSLIAYFFTPLAIPFLYLGGKTNRLGSILALGVATNLALALFHDNNGAHLVGPINYSEAIVSLSILLTFGLKAAYDYLRSKNLPAKSWISVITATLFLSAGVFGFKTLDVLHQQAKIHAGITDFINGEIADYESQHGNRKVVLLANRYGLYWMKSEAFAKLGSYVMEWPIPKPDFSDEILILSDDPTLTEKIRKHFPDRDFFHLDLPNDGKNMKLVKLSFAEAPAQVEKMAK